jgi:hypothetical protein
MSPNGKVEREIALQGKEPTNLAFGGADGKTIFVTQRQGGYVESFRTDRDGREHCMQAAVAGCPERAPPFPDRLNTEVPSQQKSPPVAQRASFVVSSTQLERLPISEIPVHPW